MTSDVQRAAQRVAGVNRLIERARRGGTTKEAEHRAAALRVLTDGPADRDVLAAAMGISPAYGNRMLDGLVEEGRVKRVPTPHGVQCRYQLDPDHPDHPPREST